MHSWCYHEHLSGALLCKITIKNASYYKKKDIYKKSDFMVWVYIHSKTLRQRKAQATLV